MKHRRFRLTLGGMAAILGVLLCLCVPQMALAWDVGDSQTSVATYNATVVDTPIATSPDTGTLQDQWVWTVSNASMDINGIDCYQIDAVITPLNYLWNEPWATSSVYPVGQAAACREVWSTPTTTMTAAIASSTRYAANDDGRTIRQVVTQSLWAGYAENAVIVTYTYGAGYPALPCDVTRNTTWSIGGFDWNDIFTVSQVSTGSHDIPGCGSIPTATLQWDWTGSTATHMPLPSFPVTGAIVEEVRTDGQSLMPLSRVDDYSYVSTETQSVVAGSPCPCIPEVATVLLLGMGLVGLGIAVWLRRRQRIANAEQGML